MRKLLVMANCIKRQLKNIEYGIYNNIINNMYPLLGCIDIARSHAIV